MKIKTANLRLVPLDYVMTSIVEPDALQYGVSDWREQRLQSNSSREYKHRYHQNMNLLRPLLDQYEILVGPSPFPGGSFAAGIGNEWNSCDCTMVGSSYEEAICRTIVAREKGQEVDVPTELLSLQDLENQYLEAAAEFKSAMDALGNSAQELHDFVAVRDALHAHPAFQGSLPQTYFSGGDLDPQGSEERPPHAIQRG
jgi:hypothetical protein